MEKEFVMPSKDSIIEVIKICGQNCYDRETCQEVDWNANDIEHLDATQWDNAFIIELLNGWSILNINNDEK